MEFTLTYILSQVFIIFNYVFLGITYQLKNHKKILLFNIVSLISAGLSYICLSAYTGLAMVFVAIFRNFAFIINENKNGVSDKININDILMLIVVYVITIVLTIFTYDSFLSLMSVLATMLYTYSIWQKNTKVYKWLAIPISIIWIIYNIYIKSFFAILLEIVLVLSAVIGLIREKKQ